MVKPLIRIFVVWPKASSEDKIYTPACLCLGFFFNEKDWTIEAPET
jgi:hypothetical protein